MLERRGYGLDLVVVTHDSARWLPGFFRSWRAAVGAAAWLGGKEKAAGVRIVVADSGSQDQSVALARQLEPGALVIECGNVGYGAAANRGAAAAGAAQGGADGGGDQGGAPWLMVCNADLTFPADFVEKFIAQVLRDAPAGPAADSAFRQAACLAPRLLNEDGSVQASVGRFPTLWGMVRDQFRRRDRRKYVFPQPTCPERIDWATGACLLLRREAFEAVGGFDGKYFLYVEEVDLARRLWERGLHTWFVPEAQVVHHQPNAVRQVRREVQRWAAHGMLRYFAKFGGGAALLGYRLSAAAAGRLPPGEAFASRKRVLEQATGP